MRLWLQKADEAEGKGVPGALSQAEREEWIHLRRENRQLVLEVRFEFISAQKAHFPVEFMCEQLGVSRSGFYAWRERPESVSLAVVLDLFSRRVVGWSMSQHIDTSLVLGALEMALEGRQPPKGLIHHSDRGSQYGSMSRKGNCWDNAVVESYPTRHQARLERLLLTEWGPESGCSPLSEYREASTAH